MKSRKESLIHARRIVVKIGSALLTQSSTNLFKSLAAQISRLQSQGYDVIVVSSGAIAVARKALGLQERPKKLATLQALAALGQPQLMSAWSKAFEPHERHVAQVLLTHADLEARERFNNARQSIDALLKMGIVPIINENDSVATEEIQVGDNDNLAAHIAALVHADLLILLTDVKAVYDSPPGENPNAQPIFSCGSQNNQGICIEDRTIRNGRWGNVHKGRSRGTRDIAGDLGRHRTWSASRHLIRDLPR